MSPRQTVYLDAYYPHTSLAFLLPSLLLFAGLTWAAWLLLWPFAIPFALITAYLARFTLRQSRMPTLAICVTDQSIYYRGWGPSLFRRGLRDRAIPLIAIGGVELVKLRSAAAAGPVIAIWLRDPGAWDPLHGVFRWAKEMAAAGDLTIACDETDRTAEQVLAAIREALSDL